MINSKYTHKQILELLMKADITFHQVSWMSKEALLKLNRSAERGWCRQLENGNVTITAAGKEKLASY